MAARIGIIGCGVISRKYIENASMFPSLQVVACADISMAAAKAKAEEHGLAAMSVDEMLAHTELDAIVNLTVPKAHVSVSRAILESGKHVHSEKPLGINRDEAQQLIAAGKKSGLRIGCAPDTFLGGGHQTCRKLIDDGEIGRVVSGTVFMMSHGPEKWHPNPFFLYEEGGGPLFDMGPYYMSALVNLLGPVVSVTARKSAAFKERIAGAEAILGQKIPVETFTHASGVLEFGSGVLVTAVFSWDVFAGHTLPFIEIYGTEGSLQEPNPNTFGEGAKLKRRDGDWHEIPSTHGYTENSRIIGLADMMGGIRNNRPHRACGELAYHALDVMCSFAEAAETGQTVRVQSTCERPAALPLGLQQGEID